MSKSFRKKYSSKTKKKFRKIKSKKLHHGGLESARSFLKRSREQGRKRVAQGRKRVAQAKKLKSASQRAALPAALQASQKASQKASQASKKFKKTLGETLGNVSQTVKGNINTKGTNTVGEKINNNPVEQSKKRQLPSRPRPQPLNSKECGEFVEIIREILRKNTIK
jgi:hypothetical protein